MYHVSIMLHSYPQINLPHIPAPSAPPSIPLPAPRAWRLPRPCQPRDRQALRVAHCHCKSHAWSHSRFHHCISIIIPSRANISLTFAPVCSRLLFREVEVTCRHIPLRISTTHPSRSLSYTSITRARHSTRLLSLIPICLPSCTV